MFEDDLLCILIRPALGKHAQSAVRICYNTARPRANVAGEKTRTKHVEGGAFKGRYRRTFAVKD